MQDVVLETQQRQAVGHRPLVSVAGEEDGSDEPVDLEGSDEEGVVDAWLQPSSEDDMIGAILRK